MIKDVAREVLIRLGKVLIEAGPADDNGPPAEVEQEYYIAMDEVKSLAVEMASKHFAPPVEPADLEARLEAMSDEEFLDLHRATEAALTSPSPSSVSGEGVELLGTDTIGYIACEVSHDVRCAMTEDEGLNRVRWNNRAMARAIKTISILQATVERLRGERDTGRRIYAEEKKIWYAKQLELKLQIFDLRWPSN